MIKAPTTNPGSTSTAPIRLKDGQNRTRQRMPRPSSMTACCAFFQAFVITSPVMPWLHGPLKLASYFYLK
jgi:hypothetical protein